MQYRQKLNQIISNNQIHIKNKIRLLQNLKFTLTNDLKNSKKPHKIKQSDLKSAGVLFESCYKSTMDNLLINQNKLLNEHKNCLLIINSQQNLTFQKKDALSKLEQINKKLRNILQQVGNKQQELGEIAEYIEDNLRLKRIKLKIQFDKKMTKVNDKSRRQNDYILSNLIRSSV